MARAAPTPEKASSYRRFLREQTAVFEANMRSPSHLAISLITLFTVPVALLIPSVADTLGLTFSETMPMIGGLACIVAVTTMVYRRWGIDSRVFRVCDLLETAGVQVTLATFIVLSETASTPFWFFYFVHAFMVASKPCLTWPSKGIVVTMPIVVAVTFFVRGGLQDATVSALMGAVIGLMVVSFVSNYQRRLSAVAFERNELERRVADLQLREERGRIARDLHDGLTADLTAIAWRAEVLAKSAAGQNPGEDFDAIARRARAAIDDTKSVVWALRDEAVDWDRLAAHVRSRCLDLCGGQARLVFQAAASDRLMSGQLAVDVVRIVQELVRNAVQHGSPSEVDVSLAIDVRVTVVVRDDGRGMSDGVGPSPSSSGLGNVRRRVTDHAGEVQLEALERGTAVRVTIPLPPAPAS